MKVFDHELFRMHPLKLVSSSFLVSYPSIHHFSSLSKKIDNITNLDLLYLMAIQEISELAVFIPLIGQISKTRLLIGWIFQVFPPYLIHLLSRQNSAILRNYIISVVKNDTNIILQIKVRIFMLLGSGLSELFFVFIFILKAKTQMSIDI